MGWRTYTMGFRSGWYWRKVIIPVMLIGGVMYLLTRSAAKKTVQDERL